MRRRDARAAHVRRRVAPRGRVEGAGAAGQGGPRSFRMPPRDGETRKSYRIADALLAAAVALCLATAAWGLGLAYQAGYHAAEAQAVAQHG